MSDNSLLSSKYRFSDFPRHSSARTQHDLCASLKLDLNFATSTFRICGSMLYVQAVYSRQGAPISALLHIHNLQPPSPDQDQMVRLLAAGLPASSSLVKPQQEPCVRSGKIKPTPRFLKRFRHVAQCHPPPNQFLLQAGGSIANSLMLFPSSRF